MDLDTITEAYPELNKYGVKEQEIRAYQRIAAEIFLRELGYHPCIICDATGLSINPEVDFCKPCHGNGWIKT